ncbi:hypothetical protein [Asanoa sp. NPDC050611]|uniref:5-methylcytosine restriction system specificity protein McrC n=1 Tax=Asanoa sp. NPDC050611 TaxID=3157098 RepID=UPI0033ECF8D1
MLVVDAWASRRHHDLVLYETNRLHVTARDPEKLETLNRCLGASRRADADGALWDSSLIAPDVEPSKQHLSAARTPAEQDRTTVAGLLELFERLNLLTPEVHDLTGIPQRSPLHRPLLYRGLLDEVLARLNSARRGYRPVAVIRSSVRGRIQPASALRYSVTSDPRLTCHYDELTESTVLLGVVCAALEWIADGRGVKSCFPGKYAEPQLRHDAVALRRALAGVTALPPRVAVVVGARLRLDRLDQPWTIALHQSLAVLMESEHAPQNTGPQLIHPVELSIPTDQLWERIVHQVLLRTGFNPVLSPPTQPVDLVEDPWLSDRPTRGKSTRPDNVAWRGQDMWVVDAKYKDRASGSSPERGDQYQMFAYSHLIARPGNTLRRAVLVYPGDAPARSWRRGRDDSETPRRLIAARIPFPTATQARSSNEWERYLNAAADSFRAAADLTAV